MAHHDKKLSARAVDQMEAARAAEASRSEAPSTPTSNTGCSLRQSVENAPQTADLHDAACRKVHPPNSKISAKRRASRARATTPAMAAWLSMWFFDWLSVTVPNSLDGKGTRRGPGKAKMAEAKNLKDPVERRITVDALLAEAEIGEAEERQALDHLCLWAVSQGLHMRRVGRAPDGFQGCAYGWHPVDGEAFVQVRAGHASSMPGLMISGGDGACAKLAPAALSMLGPVLLARADVSWDWSQAGLFDALLAYARRVSKATRMKAPRLTESDTGRTFYWGKGATSVKVYQKDLERVSKGKLDLADADPDLIRVEFRFAPESECKAGMAMVARDDGPAGLLGTVHWVRAMVEHLGRLTGMIKKGATMGVQRVERTPDPRTCADRAGHGLTQYAGTLCAAVVSDIVRERHDGDWHGAQISAEEVRQGVLTMVAAYLDATGAPLDAVTRLGVDRVRDLEAEAQRHSRALVDWMERQKQDAEHAQAAVLDAAMTAAMRAGMPATEEERAEKSPQL